MQIILNGKIHQFKNNLTITDIFLELQLADKNIAIAVNKKIIKNKQWKTHILTDKDKVDIIWAIGGG